MDESLLRQTVGLEVFGPRKLSKAQRTQIKVIEAYVSLVSRISPDQINFASIAKEAGLSRPLLMHYFESVEEILELAVNYVQGFAIQIILGRLEDKATPKEMLKAYIEAHFEWYRRFPKQVKFWCYFYFQCGIKKKFRNRNDEFVKIGRDRIGTLIKEGVRKKEFQKLSAARVEQIASEVQVLIIGNLVSRLTENRHDSIELHAKHCARRCLELLD